MPNSDIDTGSRTMKDIYYIGTQPIRWIVLNKRPTLDCLYDDRRLSADTNRHLPCAVDIQHPANAGCSSPGNKMGDKFHP